MLRVVILSSQSIFAEGVATRLKKHLDEQSLTIVDVRQEDALARVIALQPSVVILDASEAATDQFCNVGSLLASLPALTIIRLEPEQDYAQVVTSEQRSLTQVQDLMGVIRST